MYRHSKSARASLFSLMYWSRAELCSPLSESSSRPRKKTFVSSLGLLLGSRPTTDGLGSVGSTVPCGRPAGSSDTSGLS